MSDKKYVGPIAAAKIVTLIKAALGKKLDKSGGTVTGSLEINGDVHAGGAVQSDLLLSAPSVAVHNGAGASVHINCSGDNAAEISSLGSDGKSHYSRFAVGTPTGDNDATTKAYVDGKAHDYYDVTVTSSADAAQTIDGGIISVRGSADKTVAEIAAAYAAGDIVRCIYNGNIMQLVRAADGSYAFAGVGANYGVARSGNIVITIMSTTSSGDVTWITSAAGELPIPDSGESKNDCALVVKDGQWMYSADKLIPATPTSNGLMSAADKAKLNGVEDGATKTIVDDAMSDTSTNPVQNKVVKKYIDIHGVPPVSTQNDTMLIQVVDGAYALRTKESIFPVDDALDTESKNAVENGVIARSLEILQGHTQLANGTRDGLMSASDYTKLRNIESGATKIIVDATLDATSTNPVQNKAVKAALDGKAGTAVATTSANGLMSAADKTKLDGVEAGANKTTVDAALDAASENPVQNKAVKAALDGKLDKTGGTLTGNLRVTGALFSGDGLSFGTGENIHFTKAADDAGKLAHGAAGVDDTVPLARLKVAAPTEDDDAATKAYVDDRAAGSGAVRYDAAQTLDEAQQFQARKNIGAVGHDSPQFAGYLTLAPANETLGIGVGLSPSRDGNNFALDISDVNEDTPTLLTGVKTPTDADTNAAATVEYVKNKVSEVAASGGVDVDNALSATSTNPVQNKVVTAALTGKAGTAAATQSASGLMSASDKTKLDGLPNSPLVLAYSAGKVTGATYAEVREAISSGRQIKLSVANTPDIIASNARNETNKSVVIFINTDVGGDTVNIAQYTVTAQASGLTGNVKSHELA